MFTIAEYLHAKEIGAAYVGKQGSAITVRNYGTALRLAERLLGKKLHEFEPSDGTELMHAAHKEKLHPATINQMLAALQNCFKWAIGNKFYNKENPVEHVRSLPINQKIPKILTMDEMKCLFKHIEENAGRKYTILFSLMGYCGLRINEALHLRRDEIVKTGILITGKGARHSYVPVKSELLKELKAYVAETPEDEYVFVGAKGRQSNNPLSTTAAYKPFYEACKACGIDGVTPHSLRHSFATHALHKSKRLELVQDLLRHKDPKTTRRYAQISPEELTAEYQRIMAD
jgi:integrase/recombinase XerD